MLEYRYMSLSAKDLSAIGELMEELIRPLREQIDLLPTKEEHFSKMDEVMKELKDHREERAAMRHRLDRHEREIESLKAIS